MVALLLEVAVFARLTDKKVSLLFFVIWEHDGITLCILDIH